MKKKENNIEVTKLINYQLYQIFKASLNNDDQKITPTSFRSTISKKNNMWGEHRYQDSQEFFNFLISSLEFFITSFTNIFIIFLTVSLTIFDFDNLGYFANTSLI